MKTRNGFVSNSSSSSFIVYKRDLTGLQVDQIINHVKVGEKLGIVCPSPHDAWQVEDLGLALHCQTNMDNFDMYGFLTAIGVMDDDISYK